LATSLISLVTIIADFGLASAMTQISAFERVHRGDKGVDSIALVGRSLALRASTLITVVGAVLAVSMHFVETLRPSAVLVAVMVPILSITPFRSVLTGLLQSAFSVRSVTAAGIVQAAVMLGLTSTILVSGSRSAVAIAASRSVAVALALVVLTAASSTWFFQRRGRMDSESRTQMRRVIRLSSAMLFSGVAWAAISQLDVLVLGIERGPSATANYSPISGLANAVVVLPAVIGSYLLPALTEAVARKSSGSIKRLYYGMSKWSIAACSPVLGVLIVVPQAVLVILFGSRYAPYATAARILGFGLAIHILVGFNGLTLDAHGMPSLVAKRSIAGIGVSLVSCPLLVHALGINGAALATTLAITAINVQCSWSLARRFSVFPFDLKLGLVLLVFVAVSAMLFLMVHSGSDLHRLLLVSGTTGITTVGAALTVFGMERWQEHRHGSDKAEA
jgi:O-antigen/teichoic acid export membrane protein